MAESTLLEAVRTALQAIGSQALTPLTSWAKPEQREPELDFDFFASVLTDKRDFDLQDEDLLSLIARVQNARSSGLVPSQAPLEIKEELKTWLSLATVLGLSVPSVGVALVQDEEHVSFVVTGSSMSSWLSLPPESFYYPLVKLVGKPRGQRLDILEHVRGFPFDLTKECHDKSTRFDTDVLRLWSLVLSHSFDVKAEEHLGLLTPPAETPVKIEVDGDVKMEDLSGLKVIEPTATAFSDITIMPAPSGTFAGVYPPPLKRLSKGRAGPTLFDHGPVIEAQEEHMKREGVNIQSTDIKPEAKPITISDRTYVLPPYPRSWPESITRRLGGIPQLQNPPELSDIDILFTCKRMEFSKAFGGSSQAIDMGWNRSDRANIEIPGSGHPSIFAARLDWNPFLPYAPCAPGLFFRAPGSNKKHGNDPKELIDGEPVPRTAFVRLAENKWLYMGEYRVKLSEPLSEWFDLNLEQRTWWKDKFTKGQLGAIGMPVSQMHRSLDIGTKKLEVYTMECIAYHKPIQKAIMGL